MCSRTIAICLMGPTASGKTQLALDIAAKLPCEIISVDSAIVYRGMDVGTAKPSAAIRQQVPHHLIDICDPSEHYSAARFCQDAFAAIHKVTAAGKIPLLVGGTMLYFRALQQGLSPLPSSDPLIRQRLQQRMQTQGLNVLYQQLQRVDPDATQRIHAHDKQRILRALEVYEITGKSMSDWLTAPVDPQLQHQPACQFINLAIIPNDRAQLHQQIANRFMQMIEQGFVAEVQTLFDRKDLHADLPAIRSVGYRQIWQYLMAEINYQDMIERGIIATRQLAKRQLTWLRSWQKLQTFANDDPHLLSLIIDVIKQKGRCY